jgi:hypothetical protein
VQANFWCAVAGALADSPAVVCFELTSEPTISDGPDHYVGSIGDWSFVQNIATTGEQNAGVAARAWAWAWAQRLAAAVQGHDDRSVTIGVLPSRPYTTASLRQTSPTRWTCAPSMNTH